MALIDEAAVSLGRTLIGPTATTTDVHLGFLELAMTGPIRAEAVPVGDPDPGCGRLTAVVQVLDGDGRVCSHATVEVTAS